MRINEVPFQYAEKMDLRTMEYSKLHTQRFKAEFGDIDTRLKREVEALNAF